MVPSMQSMAEQSLSSDPGVPNKWKMAGRWALASDGARHRVAPIPTMHEYTKREINV
jgi:hypothetical protein